MPHIAKRALAISIVLLLLSWLLCPFAVSDLRQTASAASVVSPDGWGVVDERPTNQWLDAVWGTSSSDIFAVGKTGSIVHFNGSAWGSMTSGTDNILRGVWGSSGSDVWAVGNSGTIIHFDGSDWSDWSLPGPGAPDLWGVWGSSSTNVFFVGSGGNIVHYTDGATWDWRTVGTSSLYDVWGSSASDVYAVGMDGTILHFNGSDWSPITSATSVGLMGVWGSSSSDIFAVGDYGTIVHYNTSSGVSLGSYGSDLWGIWGSSLNDVYAVGSSGTILHYNGNTSNIWTTMDSGTAYDLFGVWGYYPDYDVYVVGAEGSTYTGVTLHYPSPTMSSVSPGQAAQGQTLDVTITGTRLDGVNEPGDVSFGAGTAVNSLPSILPTELKVSLTVSPSASPGLRDVSVSDSGDTYTLASAFEVVAAPPPDTTPPAAITNLVTSDPTSNSVILNWTAPGDDGAAGTASSYDIRYSTDIIAEADWGSASQCSGEPVPQAAGSAQTFTVTGLSPDTAYYFALKTADEVPNWSGLSNVPSEETEAVPADDQPPARPTALLPASGSADVSLTPALQASAFADPDAGDTHAASQWQIDETPWDFASPVFDSTEDTANLTSISVPAGRLTYSSLYTWRVRYEDSHGTWSDWSEEASFTTGGADADTTPPTTPAVSDDGATTTSTTSLHATWTSSDPESAIVEYQYAIGTESGSNDVVDWTSVGTATATTAAGLSLEAGRTYYVSVKARNSEGLWSQIGSSDGITVSGEETETSRGGGVPFWVWILVALGGVGVGAGGLALWQRGKAKPT